MAKTASKTTSKTAAKSSAKPKKAPAASKSISIDKAAELALEKLKAFDLDAQLQADLEWCLGSYKFDGNPSGLYDFVDRAAKAFSAAKEKKVKGVTAKLITDLEKSLKQ